VRPDGGGLDQATDLNVLGDIGDKNQIRLFSGTITSFAGTSVRSLTPCDSLRGYD